MAAQLTEVICTLTDCLHHQTDPEQPGKVFCAHPDKHLYMKSQPCPIYRMDWQKKLNAGQHIVNKINARR